MDSQDSNSIKQVEKVEPQAAGPRQVAIPARELLGAMGDRLAGDLLTSPVEALRALCRSQAMGPATVAEMLLMAEELEKEAADPARARKAALEIMQDPLTGDLVFRKI